MAAALVTVLRARGLPPTAPERAAIEAADGKTLTRWIEHSATTASVADLLDH